MNKIIFSDPDRIAESQRLAQLFRDRLQDETVTVITNDQIAVHDLVGFFMNVTGSKANILFAEDFIDHKLSAEEAVARMTRLGTTISIVEALPDQVPHRQIIEQMPKVPYIGITTPGDGYQQARTELQAARATGLISRTGLDEHNRNRILYRINDLLKPYRPRPKILPWGSKHKS